MKPTAEDVKALIEAANPLLASPEVRRMDNYLQHGRTTCLQHSLAVAYVGLCLRRLFRLRINRTSLVRGALLHDFFLYDWHEKNAGHPFPGWTHPATALYNARRRFPLNYREQNIIRSHMWPFTLRKLPRCREAVLVNLADKICSSWEILRPQPYRSLFHQLQEQRLIWTAEEKR